jgi:hypothetical protein
MHAPENAHLKEREFGWIDLHSLTLNDVIFAHDSPKVLT